MDLDLKGGRWEEGDVGNALKGYSECREVELNRSRVEKWQIEGVEIMQKEGFEGLQIEGVDIMQKQGVKGMQVL